MKRTARDKNDVIRPKPVQTIELDEKPSRVHVIVFIGFLLLALISIFFVIYSLVTKEEGWDTVSPSSSVGNCSSDFVFQYEFGRSELSASKESKNLQTEYTTLTTQAYRLFNSDECFDGVYNPAYIATHAGEDIVVHPALYHALEALTENGGRYLYFAPIFSVYEDLFACADDAMADIFDPYRQEDRMALIDAALAYATDADAISLYLLGDNTVRLQVREDYAAFLAQNELPVIDLFWMKNAFIIDFLAEELCAKGYHYGLLSCTDGFARALCTDADTTYVLQLPAKEGDLTLVAAVASMDGMLSSVTLRSFPITSDDPFSYTYDNGQTRTAFISLTDGRSYASVDMLAMLSTQEGCADLALAAYAWYAADAPDREALFASCSTQRPCVVLEERVLYTSSSAIKLEQVYDTEPLRFTVQAMSDEQP